MEIKYSDIEDAFIFASSGQPYECSAYISQETGKIYYQSDYGDFDELPEDIEDPKYVIIPHITDLDLGKRLVLNFAYEYLEDKAEDVEIIFRIEALSIPAEKLTENDLGNGLISSILSKSFPVISTNLV